MAIESLEEIQAGDSSQWIRVRGADASNPVLLLIQQGPGLPMINEARRFGHLLGLEQASRSPTGTSATRRPATVTTTPPGPGRAVDSAAGKRPRSSHVRVAAGPPNECGRAGSEDHDRVA